MQLASAKNQTGICALCLLGWIANSDGHISEEESEFFHGIAMESEESALAGQVMDHVINNDVRVIQLACELISKLELKTRKLLLELCVGMSLADGRVTTGEFYILRFLADAFLLPSGTLEESFRNITGDQMPPLSDLSSASWWRQRSESSQSNGANRGGQDEDEDSPPRGSLGWAYATLGLEHGAGEVEIKTAYRRLSAVHHPDRYVSLGDEAVQAATVTFRRITNAYEILKGAG